MALGLLSIAQGAVKIGAKIFKGVKDRREKKIEKKAASLVQARNKLAEAEDFFNPDAQPWLGNSPTVSNAGGLKARIRSLINPDAGSQAISGAANNLLDAKGGAVVPVSGQSQQSGFDPNMNKINPLLFIGGGVILLLLMFKRK